MGRSLRRWSAAAIVISLFAALVFTQSEPASAQKVANPGNFTIGVQGGSLRVKTTTFDLGDPTAPAECNDGIDNEAANRAPLDGQIDAPDVQCDAETVAPFRPESQDNSEFVDGFQPKIDVSISGTVAANGALTIPSAGIVFPVVYGYDTQIGGNNIITTRIQPTTNGTGSIDPITGAATVNISLRIKFEGGSGLTNLGGSCWISPMAISLTTGTTAPPLPTLPISGVPYNPTNGTATMVNNTFTAPVASGCGIGGFGNGPINTEFGLPAAAGSNEMHLEGLVTPVLTKGVEAEASYSPNPATAETPTSFSSAGSSAVAGIASYLWTFGDGGPTGSGASPSHTYAAAGIYNASLKVTDSQGDSDTQPFTVTVDPAAPNQAPTANASGTPTSGNAPLAVAFSSAGSGDTDGTITYLWDFGDGSPTTTAANPSHTYTTPGGYTATLTVTDDDNATAVDTVSIGVGQPPNQPPTAHASGTPTSGNAPLAVAFSSAGSGDTDGTITYSWDFGDGSPVSSAANPSHTYTTPGSYTAVLTVTDDDNAVDQDSVAITVNEPPNQPPTANASGTPTSGTVPLDVAFSSAGSGDTDGTITYSWDFGDDSFSTSPNPSHTFLSSGDYTVTLTVTDDDGATATDTVDITVNPPANVPPTAHAAATPTSGTVPLPVAFSSAGSGDTDGTITYSWDFGDGSAASAAANPSHTYTTAGNYTATLTVTDDDLATATDTVDIAVSSPVNQSPHASFTATPSTAVVGQTVSMNASGSTDDHGIASYAWDFGNSQTGSGVSATTTYPSTGTFTVTLVVTDADGATDTTTRTVNVTNVAPNTKAVTLISGTVRIPGVNGGLASVSFNINAIDFLGIKIYVGSASYSDAGAGKSGDSFLIGTNVSRYGLNGARGQADLGFSFNGGVFFGPVSFQVDDLSAIGQGADFVRIAGGGAGYVNQGTAVGGNITVLPL